MQPSPRTHSAAIQHALEEHALELAELPEIRVARQAGDQALRAAFPDADARSLERLPAIAEEITLNALIGLVDARTGEDLPRLIMRAPREVGLRWIPGNRGLHDNPDTFYRLVPLDEHSDFILEGEASAHPATIFECSALTRAWHTLGHLSREDLGIAPGSCFRVHFGPKPGPECDHFVRLTPDAEMLLLRETLADWAVEAPSRLTIENRVDRGGPREVDDPTFIARATQRVEKWFAEAIRLTEAPMAQPANHFPEPVISGEHGKLVTMAYSIGHFDVKPGQALVLRVDPGEAAYVGLPITNLFGTTNGNLASGASLNALQAERDADGYFTCVLSLDDPGCTNWLDPDGFERGFLFLRWAGLDPEKPPKRAPGLETRIVSLADLSDALPPGLRRVDATERAEIQVRRERDHALRFEEFIYD